MKRLSRRFMIKTDPSEAADSARILKMIRRYFPNAWILPTGGVVYSCALAFLIQNFDPNDPDDSALLEKLLKQDDEALEILGLESHYSVALALKGTLATPPYQGRTWFQRLAKRLGL
jgi:hypothetical protein